MKMSVKIAEMMEEKKKKENEKWENLLCQRRFFLHSRNEAKRL